MAAKKRGSKIDALWTENQPYVDNYPPLKSWLKKHNGFCQWQLALGPQGSPTSFVELWQLGKAQVIVLIHSNKHGWDLFSPCMTNKIDETIGLTEPDFGDPLPGVSM